MVVVPGPSEYLFLRIGSDLRLRCARSDARALPSRALDEASPRALSEARQRDSVKPFNRHESHRRRFIRALSSMLRSIRTHRVCLAVSHAPGSTQFGYGATSKTLRIRPFIRNSIMASQNDKGVSGISSLARLVTGLTFTFSSETGRRLLSSLPGTLKSRAARCGGTAVRTSSARAWRR